ncbi:MFS transporter [Nonomuraea sp. NPDC049625]|uniref:MFS transporter n=1 Tax=Nonomuraea sp. NPDC049625 TaxID=3155775 RepID=UPI00344294D2
MTTKTWARGQLPALLLLTSVELVVFLDVSIVNVALPAMGAALTLGEVGLAWVVNAYQLTFGGLQLLAGRLADLAGRRRVFQAGLAVFTVASLLAGVAPNAAVLIAARALQGVGAAVVIPAQLALLAAIFTAPAAYRRAFGVWSAMGAAGAASGVALGGILTQLAGWGAIFLINLPVGLAALALGNRYLPPDTRDARTGGGRLDLAGALSGTGALLALVYLVSELATRGWDALTLAAAAATVLLAMLFVLNQRRSPAPLVPPVLLRLRDVRASAVASVLVGAAHVPAFVLMSLFLQDVLGYSAIAAGFAVLPIAVTNLVTARTLLPWALGRYGPRVVLAAGMGLLATGLAAFALLLTPQAGFWTAVLPASVVFGVGLPAVFVGSTAPAVRAAPKDATGAASGLVNTFQRVGAALGVTAALVASQSWAGSHGGALADGLRLALAGAALVAVAGVACALAMLTRQPAAAPETHELEGRR